MPLQLRSLSCRSTKNRTIAKVKKDYLADGQIMGNKWYEENTMRVRSFTNNYLSVEYTWASYMGGAHDNYGFMEKVILLQIT